MTELEKLLVDSLTKLSSQYKADMQRLEQQNFALQRQVQSLSREVGICSEMLSMLNDKLNELAEV